VLGRSLLSASGVAAPGGRRSATASPRLAATWTAAGTPPATGCPASSDLCDKVNCTVEVIYLFRDDDLTR
jgi:hypothetical protein